MNTNDVWNCKCKCVSKQAHKTKWAFVSMHKKNYYSKCAKYTKYGQEDLNNESALVKKLFKKNSLNQQNNKQIIPAKRVKFDEVTQQIVIELVDEKTTHPAKLIKSKIPVKLKKAKNNKNNMVVSKNLIELRELL